MGTAAELLKDLQAVNVEQVAKDSINATSEDFSDLNREQLMNGLRSDGKKVMDRPGFPYKNLKYARFKQGKNSKPGLMNPDLNLTGAFHRGIAMEVRNNDIIVESSDGKAAELESKYGGTIYGLNVKSQDEYNQESFLPQLFQNIEKLTGLKAV